MSVSYITVARVGEIAEGTGRAFTVQGRIIAVFNQRGTYYAIDDVCPHMGASLAEGYVEDGVVACPWHAWRFRICDGTWCDNPKIKIDSFPVRVLGDEIQAGVSGSRGAAGRDDSNAPEPSPPALDNRDATSPSD